MKSHESPQAMRIRMGDWMQTYTGIQFWPLDPRPEEIVLEDIAHALSMQCRFAGHVNDFYSVAQHSVLVSRHVPPEDAAWGLMHDAAEAYLQDMIRPLKRGEYGHYYRRAEKFLLSAICDRFGLTRIEPVSVEIADQRALMTEARDLLKPPPAPWGISQSAGNPDPFPGAIFPWPPHVAKRRFLHAASELGIK